MPPVWETAVHLAVTGGVFDSIFLCCTFFPLIVLHEVWDLIESVSKRFLTYFCIFILSSDIYIQYLYFQVANIADPEQTVPRSSLIWVYTVCLGIMSEFFRVKQCFTPAYQA